MKTPKKAAGRGSNKDRATGRSETRQPGTQQAAGRANPVKDPEDWTTGDEPMTGPQQSYLHTLAQEAGVEPEDNLSKAEASRKIEELQQKTGRGREGKAE